MTAAAITPESTRKKRARTWRAECAQRRGIATLVRSESDEYQCSRRVKEIKAAREHTVHAVDSVPPNRQMSRQDTRRLMHPVRRIRHCAPARRTVKKDRLPRACFNKDALGREHEPDLQKEELSVSLPLCGHFTGRPLHDATGRTPRNKEEAKLWRRTM